jgi:hypothetical protein
MQGQHSGGLWMHVEVCTGVHLRPMHLGVRWLRGLGHKAARYAHAQRVGVRWG